MLLAIDTSSFVLSCALAEKDKLVAEWTVQKRLTHSEQLIPHMDEILKDAGVDQKEITAIAAAKGPGSFTGLRIGLATAKTAAYIWKVILSGGSKAGNTSAHSTTVTPPLLYSSHPILYKSFSSPNR